MNVNQKEDVQIYSELISSNAYEVCRQIRVILDRIGKLPGIDADLRFDIRVILSELLQNAIRHGNANDSNKRSVWTSGLRRTESLSYA